MPADARSILDPLGVVARERRRRESTPGLAPRVSSLKRYQQRRFAWTYADLLADPRYAAAVRFFLDELYGPRDFSERDAQFARVVPTLVRLFPEPIVELVGQLASLHALSEVLDSAMAANLADVSFDAAGYVAAWRATGQASQRERQIGSIVDVGAALDRLVHEPLLRHGLRLMRGPARAAGLSSLQAFLESGFDAFRSMRGAAAFIALIGERERRLAAALFDAAGAVPAGLLPPQ
jgi:hypothetical protein